MEPIIKETKVIHDDGYRDGGGNLRSKANWALGLGIFGAAAGVTALSRQGGVGNILGGPVPSVTNNYSGGGCVAPTAYDVASKECADILAVTKGYYDLAIAGMKSATAAREVDVAEKFGLYKDNRDNIDSVNNRINAELFSLYKYTRDKDDETNAKINEIASAVAVNSAVRPYQDKLIQCKIDEVYTALVNYVDRKTCRLIPGRLVLPSTPTVTGYSADCTCPAAAEAGA